MTLQINLSWWAQAILVAVIAIGVLTGKVNWHGSNAGNRTESPVVLQSPKLPIAADGWTAPTSGWMAQPTGGQ
jgi:hypothetical protein